MNNDLKQHICGMAEVAKPTQDQLISLVSGWDNYFARMHITGEKAQEQEFHGIMRARLHSGVVSVVAPTLEADEPVP
jgi:hypothetical protein